MYRIVIVDDDEIMLEGLNRNIPWEVHGFQIVGTAWNGREGYELVVAEQPDIVISDIRMPFMDGLEMTEKIKAIFPQIQVILLTGYDDFQYAKKALTLKVAEYVLKYADYDQILQAVSQARTELERTRKFQSQLEQSKNLMEERFLQDLLLGRERTSEPNPTEAPGWNDSNYYCVAMVQLQKTTFTSQVSIDHELELMNVVEVCRKLFPENGRYLKWTCMNQAVVLLLMYTEIEIIEYEALPGLLHQVQAVIADCTKYNVKIGVGNLYQGMDGIAASFRETVELIELNDLFRTKPVIFYEQLMNTGEESHQRLMQQIITFIQDHYYQESLSLANIAEVVHMCPSYICTLFKKYQKVNVSDYLINLRIEKAKELLRKTDLKNYEIAEKVGYSNAQYFSVLFKKMTGRTPTEYKKG
jgi:two-component system, response regulator YesN